MIRKLFQALHIEHVEGMQIDDTRCRAVRFEFMSANHLQQQTKEIQNSLFRAIRHHDQCGQHIAHVRNQKALQATGLSIEVHGGCGQVINQLQCGFKASIGCSGNKY